VVARWSQRLFRGVEHLPALIDRTLLPLLTLALSLLEECGAAGPTTVHGLLRIRATDRSYKPVLSVSAADQHGEIAMDKEGAIFLGGEVGLPAVEQTVRQQADRWMAELGRHAGLSMWG
jgi:hypothetical protein